MVFKKLMEVQPKNLAYFLIKEHSFGILRDETDLSNAKSHSDITMDLIIDILENFDGTIEEKIKFFKETKEEIPKFTGK